MYIVDKDGKSGFTVIESNKIYGVYYEKSNHLQKVIGRDITADISKDIAWEDDIRYYNATSKYSFVNYKVGKKYRHFIIKFYNHSLDIKDISEESGKKKDIELIHYKQKSDTVMKSNTLGYIVCIDDKFCFKLSVGFVQHYFYAKIMDSTKTFSIGIKPIEFHLMNLFSDGNILETDIYFRDVYTDGGKIEYFDTMRIDLDSNKVTYGKKEFDYRPKEDLIFDMMMGI